MGITLTISANQRSLSDLETTQTLEHGAITIGRGADNDWVLPDPERIISNRHCTIEYRDGEYFIIDTSTNGVFVNHAEDRIERGQSLKLHDRDHLSLGPYELFVRIEPANGFDAEEVTAAGLVTDIIFTSDLNVDQSNPVAANAPRLSESEEMGEGALRVPEYENHSGEDPDTEKPKTESSKEEEHQSISEFDLPINKRDENVAAPSESNTPDLTTSESTEQHFLEVEDLSQEVIHQDVDALQAHGAVTSELEEFTEVDSDEPLPEAIMQKNPAQRDTPAEELLSENLESSEQAHTAQNHGQQEDDAGVADVSEHESTDFEGQLEVEEDSSFKDDMALSKPRKALSESDDAIPEDWWKDESLQVNGLSASSIQFPAQQVDFLLETRLAEHFREQHKYFDGQVKGFYRYLQPYHWGIETLQLDEDALAQGEIVIVLARGLMPDGTFFDTSSEDSLPNPLPIGQEIRDACVTLNVFSKYSAQSEGYQNKPLAGSVGAASLKISSDLSFETQRLALRLQLDNQIPPHQPQITIARIRQVSPNQQVILDETYVPPALNCHQIPILKNYIHEILDLLQQYGNILAIELDAKSDENADVVPLLLLQIINRYEVCFAHFANAALVHPVELYQQVTQLLAEVATFIKHQRRPGEVSAYDHWNLGPTFAPLLTELRQLLRVHRQQQAMQIPLEKRSYGIFVAALGHWERQLFKSADFILEVHGHVAAMTLKELCLHRMTVGPVEQIAQLVNHKQPGIALKFLPEAPNEVTAQDHAVCFRLDKDCPLWPQLSTSSQGLGFHVAEKSAQLDMRLWVVSS